MPRKRSNAFFKDCRRQIKNTLGRYISIVAITALGVAFFAGLRATAPDMRKTCEDYLTDQNFMDIRLVSTIGFNDDDVEAVKSVSGIKSVMPGYSADVFVKLNDENCNVKIYSLDLDRDSDDPSNMNRPKITEGRMPEKQDECLADHNAGCKVGDIITFSSGTDKDIKDTLKTDTFTVVGIAESPLYISYERGTSTIGDGKSTSYFYVPSDAFSLSVYTDLYLTAKNDKGYSIFSDSFDDELLDPIEDELDSLADERCDVRFDEIRDEAEEKLSDAKKQVADSKQKLADAQRKLDDAQKAIDDGGARLDSKKREFESQIAAASKKLSDAKAAYQSGLKEYRENRAKLDDSIAKYEEGKKQLDDAKAKLDEGRLQLQGLEEQISALQEKLNVLPKGSKEYSELSAQLEALNSTYRQNSAAIEATQAQIENKEKELNAAKQQIEEGKRQLAAAKQTLDETAKTLSQSEAQLEAQRAEGEKKIEEQQQKLDDARAELEKNKKDFEGQKADAEKKIDDAEASIEDGEKELDSLKNPTWYVLDHNLNQGFASFKQDADRIEAISIVFPLIFFLVAALVSLTCMTRLVEDDRTYIGTLKALGYSQGAIAAKYLLYAISASLIGSVIGCLFGFQLFPNVIFNAYRIIYTLPSVEADFNIGYAVLSTCAAVFCAAFPAYAVCIRSLHESPASLMRPKAPRPGRRILLERITPVWKRLNFIKKVTARNLFRYKKRFFMTVIGVAGCTALLLTGFGLQNAISAIVMWQYDQIRTYDVQVEFSDNLSKEEFDGISSLIDSDSNVDGSIEIYQQVVDVTCGKTTKSGYLTVPKTGDDFDGHINLRERRGHRELKLDGNTVVISEKLATLLGANVGSTITLRDTDGVEKTVTVGGITENYLYHYVYMSPALYKELYGEEPPVNQFLCSLKDTSDSAQAEFSSKLMKESGVSSVLLVSSLKSTFQKMISAVNFVVVILIVSAALLAFVVLLSLTGINIEERRRELATIKVLGFYDNELAAYVYRENTVLTVIGIILGLLLGIVMERYVTITCEIDMVMFGREIKPLSYVYSAALTALFALMVNLFMFKRIKNIDMVSSLKSVE